jgi:hypothetical protein
MKVDGLLVELYRQGKSEVLAQKHAGVPFCPPQIPHKLALDRTRTFVAISHHLPASATARLLHTVTSTVSYRSVWHDGILLTQNYQSEL